MATALRLWLSPSTCSMQALMVTGAAEDHGPVLVAAFVQRLDVMQVQIAPAFSPEEIAQGTLTVA